jgi:uncharacterized protein YdeI (YjbR/CyaY-like superfamily)
MKTVSSIEEYILRNEKWHDALILLHDIIVSTHLNESIKWGAPAYTYQNKNVVGMAVFKAHLALWFYQGALLADPNKMLINAQEGTTKALRQMRFNHVNEIDSRLVKQYVIEALENAKAGKKVKPTRNIEFTIPNELKRAFGEDPEIKEKFKTFSLAKQRDFAFYVSSAKRLETRLKRVEKIIPLILSNEGLNDKYK